MGVDCKIYLPDSVGLSNVAKVIGAVTGCPMEKVPLTNDPGDPRWFVKVPAVETLLGAIPELAGIRIAHKCVDGLYNHYVGYHFECEQGGRLLMPRSTAFWIAVGCSLVSFFGGRVDFQDCDDENENSNLEFPDRGREVNNPQTGPAWQRFQERVFALKLITEEDWRACDRFAAYKIGD